jgi:ATP-dependent Clp endopeptidase proteolytic subunit ClpP
MLELPLFFSITLQIIIRFIYMSNDIYLIGEIGWEVTLDSVIKQVENSDKTKPLFVNIHSGGGGVYDGLAIYNYLKGLEQDVFTRSAGLVASIATIIFLAGKKEDRPANSTDSFLIHLPSGGSFGNAEDLEKTAKELRDIEDKLADIYVSETSLTKEEALDLMAKDEMLDVEFLVEKGIISNITEFKAVAKFNNKFNNKEMAEQLTKKDAENLFEKFFNKFFPKDEITSKVIQDATGIEIDFVNVAKGDEPQIGDEAEIDGKKAVGENVMANGETWIFVNGKYDSMKPKEEDATAALNDEITALKAELETSKGETVAEKATITTMTATIGEMKTEVTELKNKVVSSFDYDGKEKPKDEGKSKSRVFKINNK